MKRVLLTGAALLALAATQPALAADAPYWAPPSAAAPFNWNGFYIGANGGYGSQVAQSIELFTDSIVVPNLGSATTSARGSFGNIAGTGMFYGGQVGYNFQLGPSWLVGVESDLQFSRIQHTLGGTVTPAGGVPISGTANFNMDWFGTVRGRFGMVADSWLLFATAGLAYGQVGYSLLAIDATNVLQTAPSASATKFGYVVGAGIEYAFTPNLILKSEYQYMNLGSIGATAPVTPVGVPLETATLQSINAMFHTFRLGLNFKL